MKETHVRASYLDTVTPYLLEEENIDSLETQKGGKKGLISLPKKSF